MASIAVNRMTNANVYVNGTSHLGKVEEINLPEITHILSEHKALGMVGKFELFSGVDKMELTLKWNAFYADVLKAFADPRKALNLQVRSSLETYNSQGLLTEVPCVAYLTGYAKNFPAGNFKQQDNIEASSKMTLTAYKLEIDGNPIIEYDAMSNIYMVDGVDIFANYTANIGG